MKKEIIVSEIQSKKGGEIIVSQNTGRSSNVIPYTREETLLVINKKNCKLCQSKFREEAELMYLKQRVPSYNGIMVFLKGRGEEISWPGVRNHLIFHFRAQQKKEFLTEYASDIEKWIKAQPNKILSLRKRIAILEREMIMIGVEGEDLPLIERRKNAETLKKLADTILVYEERLEGQEKTLEPVTIIVNQLRIIINDEMSHVGSTETKKVLVKVLERLQNKVGNMVIEEEK